MSEVIMVPDCNQRNGSNFDREYDDYDDDDRDMARGRARGGRGRGRY